MLVKPVIDLADHISTDAYEVPDRLDERGGLIHSTCVFPWCTRPPRRCDKDHGVPYDAGGPTCDCNLAPLCRFHDDILWRSPPGLRFLRDHTGTRDVTDGLPVASLHDPPDR